MVQSEHLAVGVSRHHYSLGVVVGSLALVLQAGTPLRRVAPVLSMSLCWAGLGDGVASYYSVRLWLLRLGLYQLNRTKEQADDWVLIVDHTLQIGALKCMIVLGIRQSTWDQLDSRVLRQEDVDVIDLQPVTESNGKVVYKQLEAAKAKIGGVREIVSDGASDLHSGINLFCEKHPETVWMYDVKHKIACLLKQSLERDRSWRLFLESAHRFKQQISFTELAGLAPPQQRSKARYMNVEVLVEWAEKHLALLDSPKAMRAARLKPPLVTEKLAWLRKFAPDVRRWSEMLALVETTEHYVRHQGIHSRAAVQLAELLPRPTSTRVRQLRKRLLEFIEEQSQQAKGDEHLLGTSEILESIIGKYKHMAGERGQHGMTGMILGIGAIVGRLATATVRTALQEVTTRDVWAWCRQHLGTTVQSVRRRITDAVRSEQKRQPLRLENG